jgi:hypothetical protein
MSYPFKNYALKVECSGSGEMTGFLYQVFFRADHLGKLFAEPFAGIDSIKFSVAVLRISTLS